DQRRGRGPRKRRHRRGGQKRQRSGQSDRGHCEQRLRSQVVAKPPLRQRRRLVRERRPRTLQPKPVEITKRLLAGLHLFCVRERHEVVVIKATETSTESVEAVKT